MHVFIAKNDVTSGQYQELTGENGVTFHEYIHLDENRNEINGYIIDQANESRVKEIFGNYVLGESIDEDVRMFQKEIDMDCYPYANNCTLQKFRESRGDERICQLKNIIGRFVDEVEGIDNVVFRNSNGNTEDYEETTGFKIRLYSTPDRSVSRNEHRRNVSPEGIFSKTDDAYRPYAYPYSGTGIKIEDGAGNFIGEMFEHAFYISSDVFDTRFVEHEGGWEKKCEILDNIITILVEQYKHQIIEGNREYTIESRKARDSNSTIDACVKKHLMPIVKRNIVISHMSSYENNSNANKFHVNFVKSSAAKTDFNKLFEVELKEPVSVINKTIDEDNTFLAVLDPRTDKPLVLVHDNSVDILFRIKANEKVLCDKLFKEIAKFVSMTPEQKRLEREAILDKLPDNMDEELPKMMMMYKDEATNRLKIELENARREVSSLEKRIFKYTREIRDKGKLLHLMESDQSMDESIGQEISSIKRNSNVIRCTCEGNDLIVYTRELTVTDPRSNIVHSVGRFKIRLRLGKDGDQVVKYKNLRGPVNAYGGDPMQAPHVFKDGRPCLGNLNGVIPKLLGDFQLAAAVDVAIQFLQSVNVDDSAGQHVDKWPVYVPPQETPSDESVLATNEEQPTSVEV